MASSLTSRASLGATFRIVRRLFSRTVCALTVWLALVSAQQAFGQIGLIAGGGWSAPRGDSAVYVLKGLTGEAALELELGPNLSMTLGGAYTSFDADAAKLKADLDLPSSDPLNATTDLISLTLAPKLYLLKRDIAAFFTGGGGPRWITHSTTAAGTGTKSERGEQAWGVMAGFGVDAAFSEGFSIGFAPTYHRVNAERRPIEYMTFVFYLRL